MKHAIYGSATMENGISFEWLRFIEPELTRAEAEAEAVRIVIAQHAGALSECRAYPQPL